MNRSMGPLLVVLGLLAVGAVIGISLFFSDEQTATPDKTEVTAMKPQTDAPVDETPTVAPEVDPTRTATEAATRTENPTGDTESLAKGTGGLSGAVVRQDNPSVPVAGAVVELFIGPENAAFNFQGTRRPTGRTETTAADGTFTFDELPPNTGYCLVATAEGFAPSEAAGIVVRDDDFSVRDLEMSAGSCISGEVTDLYGTPIAGARVDLFDSMALALLAQPGPRKPMRSMTVDAAGKYAFCNVSLKSFEVVASAASFPTTSKSQTQVFQVGDQVINFALGEALSIAGFVVDEQGRSLKGATITAYQIGQLPESGTSKSEAVSAPNGSFTLAGLAKGQYMITGKAEGYSLKNHGQVDAGANDVRVALEPQGAVLGRVSDATTARAVTQFRLVLKRKVNENAAVPTTQTIDVRHGSGEYEFIGIDPGAWVLEAQAPGYANASSRDLIIAKGDRITGVDIVMDKGGSVSGIVTDASGGPIAGATVRLNENNYQRNPLSDLFESMQPASRPQRKTTTTDAKGAFSIALIVPGTYQVAVSKTKYSDNSMNGVIIERNQNNDLGRITLSSGGTIRGQCFDQNGKPYTDGTISVSSYVPPAAPGVTIAPTPNNESRQVKAEYNGTFEVTNLKPGEYVVQLMPGRIEGKDVNPFLQMVLSQKTEQRIRVEDGKISTVSLTVPAQPEGK
ncbi:MAG: carboxypeptidase regulatory-like domain-containing protein [Planctomycetes bacterium]|nr:carboxypeptidase regulatory-like domain-containing protein [Planctomycetota bacterium]MCC7169924.1 carboxypeptidase regulatory-like domain-containing protein [Planctomycetota bacterium]